MALYSRFKIMVLCALFQAAAADSPSFEVVSGSCTVKSDKCVYSDNFGPGQEYSDNQDCVIKQTVPFPLDVRSFNVEWAAVGVCFYDFLKVDGELYCGTEGPQGVTPAAGSELVWHTDVSLTYAGFKICPVLVPPPPVPTFEVVSGSCTVYKGDGCVYSDNFGPGQKYSDNQDCVIKQSAPFPLDVPSFDVEHLPSFYNPCLWDFLKVNGVKYCATEGPQGVTPAAGSELVWHTDSSVTRTGFKICVPRARHPDTSGGGDDWGDEGTVTAQGDALPLHAGAAKG